MEDAGRAVAHLRLAPRLCPTPPECQSDVYHLPFDSREWPELHRPVLAAFEPLQNFHDRGQQGQVCFGPGGSRSFPVVTDELAHERPEGLAKSGELRL